MKNHRRWLAIAPLVVAVVMAVVTASAGGASTKGSSTAAVSGSITVWVDAVRLGLERFQTSAWSAGDGVSRLRSR